MTTSSRLLKKADLLLIAIIAVATSTATAVADDGNATGFVNKAKKLFALDAQTALISKPVWELGVGAAFFSGHDYPASDDPNDTALALPFFVYRSERVRVQGGGVGAVAIERPRFKLDVSLGCLLYTSPSPRDRQTSRMPSSA